MTAAFEHVDEAVDVAFDVCLRVGDGVSYAGLGAEVHHGVEGAVGEEHPHGLCILEVHAYEAETAVGGALHGFVPVDVVAGDAKGGEASVFEGGVVVVVDVVEPDDGVTAVDEPAAYGAADESGCAGNQDFHIR